MTDGTTVLTFYILFWQSGLGRIAELWILAKNAFAARHKVKDGRLLQVLSEGPGGWGGAAGGLWAWVK